MPVYIENEKTSYATLHNTGKISATSTVSLQYCNISQYGQLYTLGELYMVNTYMSLGQGSLTQLASLNATGNANMYLNTGTVKADIKVTGNLALHSFAKLEGQLRLCVGGAITKESSSIIAASVEQSACDNMTELASGAQRSIHLLGSKSFELTNHLNNILAVVTDRKYKLTTPWTQDVTSATDYYAFGSSLKSAGTYRYGFNGKEKDAEGMGGGSSTYDYGFRIYNPGLGKFLSVDPLTPSFPWWSPYHFAGNTPIQAMDLDGLETYHYRLALENGKKPVLEYLGVQTQHKSNGMFWDAFDNDNNFEDYNGDEIKIKSIVVHTVRPSDGNLWSNRGIADGPSVVFNSFKELFAWRQDGFAGSDILDDNLTKFDNKLAGAVNIISIRALFGAISLATTQVSIKTPSTSLETAVGGNGQNRNPSNSGATKVNMWNLSYDIKTRLPILDQERNCVGNSLALDATLRGNPASALPTRFANPANWVNDIASVYKLQKIYPASLTEIKRAMLKSGTGATGIVIGFPKRGMGHAFNSYNKNGQVQFLDGQVGKLADTSPYKTFYFVNTTPKGN